MITLGWFIGSSPCNLVYLITSKEFAFNSPELSSLKIDFFIFKESSSLNWEDTLIKRTDRAMYEAKKTGKNKVIAFKD